MTCTSPLDGYRVTGGLVTIVQRGDRPPRNAITRSPISIPCQKCINCKMEKARQWGIRCLHEKRMWPHSSYVTLTYNDEFLPPDGSLCVRDLQLFMKKLRWRRRANAQNPIRYFIGGEYGEDNKRPHYHALLFNCGFRDLVFYSNNKRGEPLYTSSELSDLWSTDGRPLGFCTVGEVTFDSAVYCAKYALKKVTGDKAFEHYTIVDMDGCVTGERVPEFATMSRNPGIGAPYFDKYGYEVLDHDSVIINGREVRPPHYYDLRAKRSHVTCTDKSVDGKLSCKCAVCINKRKRKRLSVLNKSDNTPARLAVKRRLAEIAAEKKERKL